ncbi:MAG: thioredoxin domain-containing protein [Spirochaetes bacterium]|nr:thioredoxin domain-containing protein [Spirochaetota bacterium]
MKIEKIITRLVWAMVCLGIIISLISFLENYVPWLAALCGIFGSGCSDAAEFTLVMAPIAVWGMVFYLAVAAVYYFTRPWTFRLIMTGAGVEAALIWLMMSREIVCIFCLLNVLVIIGLLILFIRSGNLWQSLSLFLIGCMVSGCLLSIENPAQPVRYKDIRNTSIVANVNGRLITMADLESGIAAKLYKMRKEIYLLKRDHLEELIRHTLADQQGIELKNATKKPSAFKNGSDSSLIKEARRILINTLRNKPNIDQYLDKPSLPYTHIPVGNSPSTGPDDAPVTVIEFSDYQCPACKWAHPISNYIKDIYKGKIRWVFKDYPLNSHPGSEKLANAARCADEQGRFREFQNLLFNSKEKPNAIMIDRFVRQYELNPEDFYQCVNNGKYAEDIARDKSYASIAGVTMTPSFIINGRLNPGSMTLESFKQRINEALDSSRH